MTAWHKEDYFSIQFLILHNTIRYNTINTPKLERLAFLIVLLNLELKILITFVNLKMNYKTSRQFPGRLYIDI